MNSFLDRNPENFRRWYKDHHISEVERTAGLLSLEERREEKLRQSEKMKRLNPSHS